MMRFDRLLSNLLLFSSFSFSLSFSSPFSFLFPLFFFSFFQIFINPDGEI